MYALFIDFPNSHSIQLGMFASLTVAIQNADYHQDNDGLDIIYYSVHRGGSCFYSNDITVKIDAYE